MSNASAKKAIKVGDKIYSKYILYIIFSNLLYILLQFFYYSITTNFWTYFYFFLYLLLSFVSLYGLIYAEQNKITNEIYYDIFFITFLSQIISSFNNKGRLILLIIPTYFLSLGIKWYLNYKKTNINIASEPAESEKNNNQNNHQKIEKKGKTKIIRH